jgi:hypothetical protein
MTPSHCQLLAAVTLKSAAWYHSPSSMPTYGTVTFSSSPPNASLAAAETSQPQGGSLRTTPSRTPDKSHRTIQIAPSYSPLRATSTAGKRARRRHVSSSAALGPGTDGNRERMQSWRTVEGFLEEAKLAEEEESRRMTAGITQGGDGGDVDCAQAGPTTSRRRQPGEQTPLPNQSGASSLAASSRAPSFLDNLRITSTSTTSSISGSPSNRSQLARVTTPRQSLFGLFDSPRHRHLADESTQQTSKSDTSRPAPLKDTSAARNEPGPLTSPVTEGDRSFFADDVFASSGFSIAPSNDGEAILSSSPPSFLAGALADTFRDKRAGPKDSTAWDSLLRVQHLARPEVEGSIRGTPERETPERGHGSLVAVQGGPANGAIPVPAKTGKATSVGWRQREFTGCFVYSS